jgi:integrase
MPEKPTPIDGGHTRFTPVPGEPGIALRDGMYVVRSPYRKGRDSTFRTLREARHERGLRLSGAPSILTEPFCDYAPRWIEEFDGRNASGIDDETRDAYRDVIVRVAVPHFKREAVGKIDKPRMRRFVRHVIDERGLSAATARKYVTPLRAMFAEMVEDGLRLDNPATVRISGPKLPRKPKVVSPDVARAIIAEIPEALRDLVLLLAFTGLRISEACGLQWRDLAQEDGHPVLVVERQWRPKEGERAARYKPSAKTAAGTRTVRLAAPLARRLTKRRAELGVVVSSDPMFATSNGTPYDRHNVGRALRSACDRAGVPRIGPHVLRHSIGSLLYERGWTDVEVAAFLGHEDPSFTRRTYLHAVRGGDVTVLDGLFGEASS